MTDNDSVQRFPKFIIHRMWEIAEIARVGDLSLKVIGSFAGNGPDEYSIKIGPIGADFDVQIFGYGLGTEWSTALIRARGYSALLEKLAKHWGVAAEIDWIDSDLDEENPPERPEE
ncbi:hypothetical protein BOSEA31B_11474 [Hyphomicrobiales bacterium]|nr:hypothetical protein BOSEA31B_11474 [Hyphomicrobiales bacterium]CAH1697270.1 hypothetical protein BOSEA1005_10307 [Hyphomicrobiales bacterium]CAI0342837.1 hypothetical protein BO1005MUT1_10130 [Hyphomicrobiales bacterium]